MNDEIKTSAALSIYAVEWMRMLVFAVPYPVMIRRMCAPM